jgi:hypothetical protein
VYAPWFNEPRGELTAGSAYAPRAVRPLNVSSTPALRAFDTRVMILFMSTSGQKRQARLEHLLSALTPKADMSAGPYLPAELTPYRFHNLSFCESADGPSA